MKNNFIGYVRQTERHVFKLNKLYLICGRQTDMKKMRWGFNTRNVIKGPKFDLNFKIYYSKKQKKNIAFI
jgi:hypothetical protein